MLLTILICTIGIHTNKQYIYNIWNSGHTASSARGVVDDEKSQWCCLSSLCLRNSYSSISMARRCLRVALVEADAGLL